MWEHLFKQFCIVVYLFILLAIALYGIHRYVLVYLYMKHRHHGYQPKRRFGDAELPRVTVQLPMYNEDVVAERIIKATCLIDYPLDRLDIQVLDDSTDHSADIARRACEDWAARGYPITYGIQWEDGSLRIKVIKDTFPEPIDLIAQVALYESSTFSAVP